MTTEANTRMNRPLREVDPEIAEVIDETRRQATGLELIPSENLVSRGGARSDGLGADQ